MKAFVYREYGLPEGVVKKEDVDTPVPGDSDVLIRIRAAAANPMDYHFMKGMYLMRVATGLRRPKKRGRPGVDLAGEVQAVGKNVTRFKKGDEVFGVAKGAFSEFACAAENKLALKGALTFQDAAAIPVAAMTALQGLRDKGRLQPGQTVLINGASGGVGAYAVQIAKSMGAEVTGVCSKKNLALVRSLGADHVIDYTQEDFTQAGKQYDLLFDAIGNHRVSDLLNAVSPKGTFLPIGVRAGGMIIGPIPHLLAILWSSWFGRKRVLFFMANVNPDDLAVVRGLIESGKVRSVIDRVYSFDETPEAIAHLEQGHARGKVVVAV